MIPLSISIVVPVYNRSSELLELLESILSLKRPPDEVILSEDCSPERIVIRSIVESIKPKFSALSIPLTYLENECNLGYDKNLRKCIESSKSDWAFVMGNDDVVLSNALSELDSFLDKNPNVNVVSRSFLRFTNDIENPLGISSICDHNTVFVSSSVSSKYVFRSCGFIGGFAVNVAFAKKYSSDRYDGGLYYQILLACHAFCSGGIGYISTPIVGGRADNPPLFGMSKDEENVHVPGGYTAKGRAKMWSSVLSIASDVGTLYGTDLVSDIRLELAVRQSFHIFEMNAGSSKRELGDLKSELNKLGLFSHWLPKVLYMTNVVFGKRSKLFYRLARKVFQ